MVREIARNAEPLRGTASDYDRLVARVAEADVVDERLERYVGVVYRSETERQTHYLEARLAEEYDYVIHIDHTNAVEPLDPT